MYTQSTAQSATQPAEAFAAARFIKEIGRGKKGARSLSRGDAFDLYAAMLDGRVSDLELGAIMLAMRIKGESVEEIAGFLDAAEASFDALDARDRAEYLLLRSEVRGGLDDVALARKRLAEIAAPDEGVVTNIGPTLR